MLVVVNLNPEGPESGWTALDLEELGVAPGRAFDVEDLYGSGRYRWSGPRNFVRLDPSQASAHIFRVVGAAGGPP